MLIAALPHDNAYSFSPEQRKRLTDKRASILKSSTKASKKDLTEDNRIDSIMVINPNDRLSPSGDAKKSRLKPG